MDLKLKNADQLKQLLQGLDESLRKRILTKALNMLSKPILEKARDLVWSHQRKGRLYRSLGQKSTKKDGLPMLILGAKKTGKYRGSHAHFLENGTVQRYYITKTGKRHNTGKTTGISYWTSSIESTDKSAGEFQNYIIQSIGKEVDRLNKKAK